MKITDEVVKRMETKSRELAESGMQVIALACKNEYPGKAEFNSKLEKRIVLFLVSDACHTVMSRINLHIIRQDK